MPLPDSVAQLVHNFAANRIEYHKGDYNETLILHKGKAAARLATEKNMMQVQIEATDKQIDALVYDLYGLTEDEIKVVEGVG